MTILIASGRIRAMALPNLFKKTFPAALILLVTATVAADTTRVIGNFAAGALSGWTEKEFSGKTAYRLIRLDGNTVLAASSNASASGLYRKIAVDLTRTPYLNWSWRVDDILKGVDETTRGGDDYAARIYVIFSRGWFFWQTHALNYVWSSNQPPGTFWPNAYTSHAVMVAAQSGEERTGTWVTNKRNVRDDIKRYMGMDVSDIEAVAIMTDTDNSGQHVTAYYGDIWFSAD